MLFENLEYITIVNQTTSFPKHFHETFCISLIHKGIEQIDFENQSLFTEAGSISITNPYEIHSNPLIDNNSYLKFDTIYIPNKIMKYILNGENIRFINRQITSKKANKLFLKLKQVLDVKNDEMIKHCLTKFINILKQYSEAYEKEYSELKFDNFSQKHIHHYRVDFIKSGEQFEMKNQKLYDNIKEEESEKLKESINKWKNENGFENWETSLLTESSIDRDLDFKKFMLSSNGEKKFGFINLETKELKFVE